MRDIRIEPAMPTRRLLLKAVVIAGGGLVVGLHLPSAAPAADLATANSGEFVPNAFVRIEPHGAITLIMPHTEVGQGIYTSAAMLIGEELEVGLDQIQVQAAPPDLAKYKDPLLGDQATGGSASIRSDWMRLRQAGAAARIMLIAAAAKNWGVDPASCRAERAVVHHDVSGRTVGYGEIASDAAGQPVPQDIPLKQPNQFKLIGTDAKRLDTPSKVNGTALFGIDAKVAGMRIGTLAITPVKGGKLVQIDEAAARRVPGVHDVVRAGDEAIAVIGDHMWAARQGLEALRPVWDAGPNGGVTTQSLIASMDQASRKQGVIAKQEGDAAAAIKGAATRLSEIYQLPFLSHSPMEPLNCTLHITPDRAEIWVGTQVPVRAQKAVADATGLPVQRVTVNNLFMGGAFGRRLDVDSIAVAAAIAKQVPYPVKLVWTREEDLRHDYYRPYYYDRVAAGLDAGGKLVGWTHRVTGPSILARWAPAAFKNGLDTDAVECAAETPYDVPATFVDYVRHEPDGMNTGWWRGVGPTHNVFVVESFVDELAAAAKQDPVAFRRALLQKNPRALAVLNLAAEKAGWGDRLPPNTGRGVSVQFAFGTYLCCVIEAEVSANGEILLHRAVVAVDCGATVNPDTVRAQIEGGLILGLSTAMYNEITLTNGIVDQSNFHDYRAMRINETPVIEVLRIDSNEKPGGIGETGTVAAAPALGNAIFAATGRRLRRLPFGNGQLQAS
jgi:isoquinoline 1-oxidoreductase beta subunit